ncbi:MAG TPA: molybdopterin-dependent oxidoreductase [Kofleriaceae bacterium]|nr:molybdopterin-dependent oxidoreductase [Kofleriaceae bacterium]
MRRPISYRAGIALGAMCTLMFVAVAAVAAALFGIPNPAYRLFELVSGALPGVVVTSAIDIVVKTVHSAGATSTAAAAKEIERAMAIALATGLGGVLGAVVVWFVRRGKHALLTSLVVGTVAGCVYVVIAGISAIMIVVSLAGFVAWGGVLGVSIRAMAEHAGVSAERRQVLVVIGVATAATCAVAFGLVRLLGRGGARISRMLRAEDEAALTSGPAASPSPESLTARFSPVDGTRAEITDNAHFYRIDINLKPPSIDGATWTLPIEGLVGKPRVLTLDELRRRPAVSQIITLECISNPVGGDLIGTSRWTGIRLADLLAELEVASTARALSFEAADGFHETCSLDDARDPRALLVYAMNGEPLTEVHGYPLRLYLPDRHGMKLPKWITRMELVADPRPGYWVERGWSAAAIPHTTSVIDAVTATGDGAERMMSIGGIAYAGARGIQRVEVQIDDGAWQDAQLRTPALSPLTWVQWRLDVPYRKGKHTIRVRATDGTGALQDTVVRPPHPDGATGIYTKRVDV